MVKVCRKELERGGVCLAEERIRVVLADNNRELCKVLAEHIGIQDDMELVGIAYDGLQAIELIQAQKPDVLILDITMPYLDGIGVMERLAEMSDAPQVIVLTAFEQESMVQRLIAMGAVYYMVKPFDTLTLLERIRQFGRNQEDFVKENRNFYSPMPTPAKNISRQQLELEVTKVFHEMGVPAHFRGYAYLRDAIIMAIQEEDILGNITKNLYPRIAEKYNSTASGVESAIRHTIEIGWERGNCESFKKMFGTDHYQSDKARFPTAASFIAKVADRIRLQLQITS
ncbi:sporulation transcription factor Spo0A [Hydrogenispora sp. UU3]|uniref:Stage 0 sporulation protein A homolog n=1 Tax=Capillibacterium thermochitinicola TaxID=2699427 RepID=A0A8J6HY87_9FIRM|nr:sporulation transcription factor Spo0A [Capillibacterium thermochitinicola]